MGSDRKPSVSPEQEEYVAYHSSEQRAARMAEARQSNDVAVSEAHHLFFSGDIVAARDRLFSAGIQVEGISYHLTLWGSDYI